MDAEHREQVSGCERPSGALLAANYGHEARETGRGRLGVQTPRGEACEGVGQGEGAVRGIDVGQNAI